MNHKVVIKIVQILLLSVLPLLVFCQNNKILFHPHKIDFTVCTRIGMQQALMPSLKNKLNTIGYSMPQRPWLNLEAGLSVAVIKDVGIGFDYSASPSLNSLGSIQQLQGLLSFKMITNDDIILTPEIGFGKQIIAKVLENASASADLDSLIHINGNSVKLKTKGSFMSISAAFLFKKIPFLKDIRIGYTFGIKPGLWESGNQPLSNSPDNKVSTFYIQFGIPVL